MPDPTNTPPAPGTTQGPTVVKEVTKTVPAPVRKGVVEVEYKTGFTYSMRDGSQRMFKPGKQMVPQEVADAPYAQHHQVDVPEELTAGLVKPYGAPDHEVEAFEARELPSLESLEGEGVEEIPTPSEKGLSERRTTGRTRIQASD